MDGARRLLRSVNGLDQALAPPRAAFAGAPGRLPAKVLPFAKDSSAPPRASYPASSNPFAAPSGAKVFAEREKARPQARDRSPQRNDWRLKLARALRFPGVGFALTLALFGGVGLYGSMLNGSYANFIEQNGRPRDIAARMLGFGVDAVTLSGQIELSEAELLQKAGVDARQSLMFLDVDDVRRRLMTIPLVKNANVRKLFPSRLVIEVREREPYALWQKDGSVSIIAADGAAIDSLRDEKFTRLPFVVGDGANLRIDEFLALLDAAGDLRPKIRAGILISQRRWTLKMTSGVEVMLPENNAKAALAQLVKLENESHILEKDVVSLDFRTPGRMYARLTEEAAAAREAALPHRGPHAKAAQQ